MPRVLLVEDDVNLADTVKEWHGWNRHLHNYGTASGATPIIVLAGMDNAE